MTWLKCCRLASEERLPAKLAQLLTFFKQRTRFLYSFCDIEVKEMKALVKKWVELTFMWSWVSALSI